jgi:hypothetical protein
MEQNNIPQNNKSKPKRCTHKIDENYNLLFEDKLKDIKKEYKPELEKLRNG